MRERLFVYMKSKLFKIINASNDLLPDFEKYETDYPLTQTSADEKLTGGYEITRIFLNDSMRTEHGIQGSIEIYKSDGIYATEEEELEANPGWNMTCYQEGFQQFLGFYTCPSEHTKIKELHLYIPYTAHNEEVQRRLAKFTFDSALFEQIEDMEPADQAYELFSRVVGTKVDLERILENELIGLVDEKFLDPKYVPPWHR